MNPIRVVIIDDHPIFRQGVVDSFSLEPDFSIVGQESDGHRGLLLIRALQPNVAVVDVNLPTLNGLQIAQQVRAEKIPTRVVLLTAYDDPQQSIHAMQAGAWAFCSKEIQPEQLITNVRLVMENKYVILNQVMSPLQLKNWLSAQAEAALKPYMEPGKPYEPLSEREREVLIYLTRGMSNKEIAMHLGISYQTVKNHVTSILRKLSVNDRTQAAVFALKHGWVRLHPEDQ